MTFVKLAAAAAIAVSATTATAGGLAPEVMEAPVVMVDAPAQSSLGGLLVPAILLALLAVAASSSGT